MDTDSRPPLRLVQEEEGCWDPKETQSWHVEAPATDAGASTRFAVETERLMDAGGLHDGIDQVEGKKNGESRTAQQKGTRQGLRQGWTRKIG